jgi:hypothetical protein
MHCCRHGFGVARCTPFRHVFTNTAVLAYLFAFTFESFLVLRIAVGVAVVLKLVCLYIRTVEGTTTYGTFAIRTFIFAFAFVGVVFLATIAVIVAVVVVVAVLVRSDIHFLNLFLVVPPHPGSLVQQCGVRRSTRRHECLLFARSHSIGLKCYPTIRKLYREATPPCSLSFIFVFPVLCRRLSSNTRLLVTITCF